LLLQAPAASQVPEQRPFGSASLTAAAHTWFVPHCWQVPGQSASTQQPLVGMQVLPHGFMLAPQV
jgi:hypothetical protein